MSYILDALKKSDQERKRGDVPGLQTVHIPMSTEASAPRWLYAVLALLMLVLAFVVGLMVSGSDSHSVSTRPDSGQATVPTGVALDESDEALTEKAPGPASAKSNQLIEPQPGHSESVATAAVNNTEEIPPVKVTESLQTLAETSSQSSQAGLREAPASAPVSVQDLSEVPYLHELADYQQQLIPEMQFAGHVYSSSPASRSIIINNVAMSEGDNVMRGLKIEQITSNGVVFHFQDIRFKIDILQDWSFE